jgi:dinuclear metal center YbgI/SA1388 family protein
MELSHFSEWLRELLQPGRFKDYCPNGLCVEAAAQVTRVVTGVSFRAELIEEAVRTGADCILVHHPHGFWNSDPRLPVGALGRKMQLLMRHGISLFGFHLPLDAHPEIGNNALIAKGLGLEPTGGFMREGEDFVGVIAEAPAPLAVEELKERYETLLGHKLCHFLPYGPVSIQSMAICSGGGISGLPEALSLGAQAYLTGEIKEITPILAAEEGVHILAGGHHRSEIFGVRALAEKIERDLGIPAVFCGVDNAV